MTEIHELDAVLADQIAAGEVVERPASVVKELVENALDAKSSRIDILIEEAGLKSIRVIDDGQGIESSQVLTAFKRHATSKITSREDLFRVGTLGFRGEALPSIASISEVNLTTSIGTGVGTKVNYKGGKLLQQTDEAVRRGTDITVTNLFYNTPARLKYLKSNQTELAKISDIVNRLALSFPSVAFSLTHDNRNILRTNGRDNQLQVISGIYGVQNARKMLPISNSNVDFEISGYISLPELTRSNRNYISVLINGRYVKNFAINKAIVAGYGSKLMVGRYPIVVLNIKMNPIMVDVNVHPTKQEVRISEESELSDLISETIYQVLAQQNLIPDAMDNLRRGTAFENKKVEQMQLAELPTEIEISNTQTELDEDSDSEPEPIIINNKKDLLDNKIAEFKTKYANGNQIKELKDDENIQSITEVKNTTPSRIPSLSYIGQFHGTYLLAEAPDGLYIVDQHAAQERVNYEHYRVEIGQVSDDQQDLLVPIHLEYPTSDALIIMEHQTTLAASGLHLEPFGTNSFLVTRHPTWFKEGQEESTIREMIDFVLNDHKITVADFREATAIMMSCKRAIKANHHLDDRESKYLLQNLAKCENPFNCPHGRPVLVHFSPTDMEKMFKRIQDSHESGMVEE